MNQEVILTRKKASDQKVMVQVDQATQEAKVDIINLNLQIENIEVVLMLQKEMKEDDKDQLQENQALDDEVVIQKENSFLKF